MVYDITKADWKLFQEKLPNWQENFMRKLNYEYIRLLTEPKRDSEKFWELEERICKDKKTPGVRLELRKGNLYWDIAKLIHDKVITFDDLEIFSDDLKEAVKFMSLSNE